jgi:hypothetical protein
MPTSTTTTGFDDLMDDMVALTASIPPCTTPDPMITYGTGPGPSLNYNVPQANSFITYSKLLKYIDKSLFKDFTKRVPPNNFYDMVANMSNQEVNQIMHPNVTTSPAARILPTVRPSSSGFGEPQSPAGSTFRTGTSAEESTFGLADRQPDLTAGVTTAGSRIASEIAGAQQHTAANTFAQPVMEVAKNTVMWIPNSPTGDQTNPLVDYAKRNIRPYFGFRMMNKAPIIRYIGRPFFPTPSITVIEELTTQSYLGDYGAGPVVKTFSLLPGEKTTITVRTYEDRSSTASTSDNVIDSFSDSSATELDTLLQQEQGASDTSSNTDGGAFSQFSTYSDSQNSSSSSSASASMGLFDIFSAGGGYGQSSSSTSDGTGGMTNNTNYSNNATRTSNVNSLNNALNKHVQQSNASRQMDVNNTTTDTADSGEEDTTVREIQNYNKSRVLNFTYRQLLQEYFCVTYLSNLKFAYTNGYPESYKITDLAGLQAMLTDLLVPPSTDDLGDIIHPTPVEQVMCLLVSPYFNVPNYNDDILQFAELSAISAPNALVNTPGFFYVNALDPTKSCAAAADTVLRKVKGLTDTYTNGDFSVTVPGVVLSGTQQTLLTPSVIVEALLGTVNALDCYNNHAQDAEATALYIKNLADMQDIADSLQTTANTLATVTQDIAVSAQQVEVVTQQLDIVTGIVSSGDTNDTQASAFKKVFGSCCPTPQYTGGCGCGNCTE